MDAKDMQLWRSNMRLTQRQAGAALGVAARTIKGWEAGENPIPQSAEVATEAWTFAAKVIEVGGAGAFVMTPPVPLPDDGRTLVEVEAIPRTFEIARMASTFALKVRRLMGDASENR